MSERPTPETDAAELVYDGKLSSGYADVDVCRKLERERDDARAKAKAWKESAVGHRVNNSISRAQRDAALQKIEDLEWQGVHSCHDQCQRPACVLRRERDELRAQVQRLKDGHEGCCYACEPVGELNAELEKELIQTRRERDDARAALQRLADCDWVITPRDRMDAVREIAREALAKMEAAQ